MLWAIPIGMLAGAAIGGSLANLARFRLRWAALAVAGLLIQLVLFTPLGDSVAGGAGPAIYVATTLAVFATVLRNIRLAGMPIVALGALSNLAAITANGGSMPASAAALATAGLEAESHTNSVVLANPALEPLTDIFALPASLPLANVFSVGDVLIGVGLVIVVAAAMRRPAAAAGLAGGDGETGSEDEADAGVEARA
ncbi:MAG TPA: DUF5317 family protein [Candidatus Limnocylindria bacterium]|nr:DUF5317 family protein [Candidatus Limnocylindria bacterium]